MEFGIDNIIMFLLIFGLGYWFLFRDEKRKLTEIAGITIVPAEDILKEVSDDILNAVKVTGNEVNAHVIYRGMTLGKAKGVIETTARDDDQNTGSEGEGEEGKKRKKKSENITRYMIFWLPRGGTIKKKDDLLLIVPAESVQIGKDAFLIDSNLNLYPITENVFFGGKGFFRFADFVNLRAVKEMLGDIAQVQSKYYALNPQTASEFEVMKLLNELRQRKIREVI